MPNINVGGLVSGLNTNDIIAKLGEAARIPIQRLELRKAEFNTKLDAWQKIALKLVGFRLSAVSVSQSLTAGTKKVSSSDENILTTTVTGSPSAGARTITVTKLAQSEESLSQGFQNVDTKVIGTGNFQIVSGNGTDDHDVNETTKLSFLNNGTGINLGSIQITDRSGAVATIDLSQADDIQDVLDAISSNTTIKVTAKINKNGNGISIQDDSGSTNGNLKILESGGTTASTLGILTASSGVSQNEVQGTDLYPKYNLNIDATNNTLNGIRDAINNLKGPFVASIINDGSPTAPYRLSITNRNTGTIGQLALTSTSTPIANELVGTGDGSKGAVLGDYKLAVSPMNNIADITSLTVGGVAYSVRAIGAHTGVGLEVEIDINNGKIQFFNNNLAQNVTGEIRASYTPAAFSFSEIQTAQDAEILMGATNPVIVKSHTNTLNQAIAGLKIDLLKADAGKPVTISVENDVTAMTETIIKFITDYNDIVSAIQSQNAYNAEKKERGGPLFGDGTLRIILSGLQKGLVDVVPELASSGNSIFQIGIKPGENGTLAVDKEALQKNLIDNMDVVKKIFSNNKNVANNALVTASSSAAGFNISSLTDGQTTSEGFGPGVGWQDNTPNSFPDDVTLQFQNPKYFNKVVVHTVNSVTQPASSFGIKDYDLQYLKIGGNPVLDADWLTAATVTNNTQGQITHSVNVQTERFRIRIKGTNAADGYSKLVEVETFEDNAIGARIKNELTASTDATSGAIFFRQDGIKNSIKSIDGQMQRLEERVKSQEILLLKKFAEMERILGQLQTTSSTLTNQIASLNAK
ncbi:MAG: flagellar filament capping protein FliD [Elusimicrobiota bacterium]